VPSWNSTPDRSWNRQRRPSGEAFHEVARFGSTSVEPGFQRTSPSNTSEPTSIDSLSVTRTGSSASTSEARATTSAPGSRRRNDRARSGVQATAQTTAAIGRRRPIGRTLAPPGD